MRHRLPTTGVEIPDAFERRVRLVCGGILGLVLGVLVCLYVRPLSMPMNLGVVLASVVACAFGALRYGDKFWIAVIQAFRV
jgi:CHASE2 domain-containing sensor protein